MNLWVQPDQVQGVTPKPDDPLDNPQVRRMIRQLEDEFDRVDQNANTAWWVAIITAVCSTLYHCHF